MSKQKEKLNVILPIERKKKRNNSTISIKWNCVRCQIPVEQAHNTHRIYIFTEKPPFSVLMAYIPSIDYYFVVFFLNAKYSFFTFSLSLSFSRFVCLFFRLSFSFAYLFKSIPHWKPNHYRLLLCMIKCVPKKEMSHTINRKRQRKPRLKCSCYGCGLLPLIFLSHG